MHFARSMGSMYAMSGERAEDGRTNCMRIDNYSFNNNHKQIKSKEIHSS